VVSIFRGAVAHSTAHACSLAREVENQSETSFCHWLFGKDCWIRLYARSWALCRLVQGDGQRQS
jgi:hypothetical protein